MPLHVFLLYSGSHVLIVAQRTMLSKTFARSAKNSGPRPRTRTLQAVQEAILEVSQHLLFSPRVAFWLCYDYDISSCWFV
jgi:hypothetical protein